MKKILTLGTCMVCALSAMAAEEDQTKVPSIYIRTAEADRAIPLDELAEITLPQGSVVLTTTTGSTITVADADLISLRFTSDRPQSGLSNASVLPDVDTSEVYDLQGRRVNPANLPAGVYIKRSGAVTTKFVRK